MLAHAFLQAGRIPLLGIGGLGNVLGDEVVDDVLAHLGDGFGKVLAVHQRDALLENDLALVVLHVVVFQQVLADVEVARLDLLLGLFQRLVDPGMDDRLVFLEAELLQHAVHAVGAEDAHQIVLDGQVEFRAARVALAAGAAAQLVVDAARFVAFGGQHVEAAGGNRLFLQALDVVADRLFLGVALGAGFGMSASSSATRMSALPPSWMSVPRPAMLVAMVMAPGVRPGRRWRLPARGSGRSAPGNP